MNREDGEMKKVFKDDPEFTAKALGERSEDLDAAEIAAEDRPEFEELQAFAGLLGEELKAGADREESIGEERVEAVKHELSKASAGRSLRFPVWFSAAAACLAMGLLTTFVVWTNREEVFSGGKNGVVELSTEPSPLPMDLPPIPMESLLRTSSATVPEPQDISIRGGSGNDAVVLLDEVQLPSLRGQGAGRAIQPPVAEKLSFRTVELKSLEQFVAENKAVDGSRFSSDVKNLRVAFGGDQSGNVKFQPSLDVAYSGASATREEANREGYNRIVENVFQSPLDSPLSTFSIDVDTASYANVRRMIEGGRFPPADAVRIEELVNYFRYDYAQPTGEAPFSVSVDSASAPWKERNRLVRIGLQGKVIPPAERPAANLVFLVDVSGSMSAANKLPLARKALGLLVEQMDGEDRIAVVVYAGSSGLALPSTTANNKETILHALGNLKAGGSTNGGSGITLAYEVAQKHLVEGGINRVILCTDGDFNVGVSDQGALTRLIEENAASGVFFSAIGFGSGNYRDDMMESFSNRGNGNYAYVDSESEARKVFVEDMLGTLLTIAKDVKIQVEFNPALVESYRLIGYENRALAARDFNDDRKDAGEIGSGHGVTALYEVVPAGSGQGGAEVDPLRYQSTAKVVESEELLTVKLRYKLPEADTSSLLEHPFVDSGRDLAEAGDDLRFAAAVAGFGMLLRDSEYANGYGMSEVVDLARASVGRNEGGHKLEFVDLAHKAKELLLATEARDLSNQSE